MPHITVDYSGNLAAEIGLDPLLDTLHAAALATGLFPAAATHTRARRCDHARIGDGDPANGFVHVTVRVAHGRDLPTRQRIGERLFAVLTDHLAPVAAARPLAVSMEVQEIDPEVSFGRSSLRDPAPRANAA